MKLYGNTGNRNAKDGGKAPGKGKKRARRRRLLFLVGLSAVAVVLAVWALLESSIRPPKQAGLSGASESPQASDSSLDADGASMPPTPGGGYKDDFYTVLLLGTDEEDYNADVIMVAAFDKKNGKVEVVSVPRDTMVDVSRSNKKINACYGVGKSGTGTVEGGVAGLSKALRTVIGFAPDYYCVIKFKGFEDLVNAIGGVKFNVEQDLVKKDGPPYINIKKGLQVLDGETALELVRFRGYSMGDLTRIDTAHKFLKATAKQMLSVSNIPKIPELAGIVSKNLTTNLSVGEMIWFATEISKLDTEEDISFYTIPYTGLGSYNGQSYLFADKDGIVDLVNRTVNPYNDPITADNLDIIHVTGTKSSSSGSSKTTKASAKPSEKPAESAAPETQAPEESAAPSVQPEETEPPETEEPAETSGLETEEPAAADADAEQAGTANPSPEDGRAG